MFEQFFGNYLVEREKLSKAQLDLIISRQKETRVKLGLIAVSEKMLTVEQADKINMIQSRLDRRFGDIAVDVGYLSQEQVSHLLSLQANPYLCFVQTVTENGFMDLEEIEEELSKYQAKHGFTLTDMEALKSGDVDRIVPLFVPDNHAMYYEYISLAIRTMSRFLHTSFYFGNVEIHKEYRIENMACQKMDGNHDLLVGLSGGGDSLLAVADPFSGEAFDEVDEDALDSVCEFINCVNGLFASSIGARNIDMDMCPPEYYRNRLIRSRYGFLAIPLYFDGNKIDLITIMDIKYDIIDPE